MFVGVVGAVDFTRRRLALTLLLKYGNTLIMIVSDEGHINGQQTLLYNTIVIIIISLRVRVC